MAQFDDRSAQFDAARDRRIAERRTDYVPTTRVQLGPAIARASWSGIWGGFLLAIGIFLVLAALVGAIGLSQANPGASLRTMTYSGGTLVWLYIAALIGLFFGGALGTRLGMVVDSAAAWLEGSLIWVFMLLLAVGLATGIATFLASAAPAIQAQATSGVPAARMAAGGWWTFVGMIVAWIVTVLGSLWGRAAAEGRAHQLGLAA
jgi:hypothetical protein